MRDSLRGARQRGLGVAERFDERRPDAPAQAVAREAVVVVAVVIDPAQTMPARVRLDRFARDVAPWPRKRDAVANDELGHRRERGDAAAAQRLQQEGLGLVATMVAEQDQLGAAGARHLAERAIARAARPRFDALACARPLVEAARRELDRKAAPRPAKAKICAMCEPRVGVGAQAMMDVQREHRNAERRSRVDGRVEERGRVAAAAPGDGDDACTRSGVVSARWCR